jgi:membrane protease YdiL (CAAX protease family)
MDDVGEAAVAKESGDAPPMARPVAVVPHAMVVKAARFGAANLTRSQAAVDLFLIFAALYAGQFALAGVGLWLAERFPSFGILWANVLIGTVGLGSVAVVLYARGQSPGTIGLGRPTLRRTLLGTLAAVPACYVGVVASVTLYVFAAGIDLAGVVQERGEFFEMVPDLSLGTLLIFTLFVGLHEEVLFRGFVLGRFCALFGHPAIAVLASGLIFGLLHVYQGPIGVIQTTTVGLVLAGTVIITRSLWPAIFAHFVFDTIGLLLIPLLRDQMPEMLKELDAAVVG